MGYYIQTPLPKNKAYQIEKLYCANILSSPPSSLKKVSADKAIICVIDNGLFEAAAFCYSEQELQTFVQDDSGRPKTWLLMDLKRAKELTGYEGS